MCGGEIVKIVLCGGVRNIDDTIVVGEGGVYSVSRFPHRGLFSLHHPHSHLHSSPFSSFFLFYFSSILFSLFHSIPYRISISLCIFNLTVSPSVAQHATLLSRFTPRLEHCSSSCCSGTGVCLSSPLITT